MFTSSASTLWRNASSSSVRGHCKNALPANATKASRSVLASRFKSSAASWARRSRFGATSAASMLLEVSMPTTMSNPRERASSQLKPICGLASDRTTNATAMTIRATRAFWRPVERPTVRFDSNLAATNCAINCRFTRPAHQKNATNAGTRTSRNQRRWGFSNCIAILAMVRRK